MIAPYEDQIATSDVTPDDFGRIAAQTAKQVILQRIREAERQMMYDEYQDRVGELITGIIQQSDKRYTLVQLRERVEALLPKSEQVYNERYDHGMRVKAVITDVSDSTKGPAIVVSRRSPELIKKPVRARGAGDRRQAGRDRRRRPRARLPLEDRRRLPRRRGRPGRRLRRPARLAGADGRLRAARREDRHHPPQRRARPLRRQSALAGARARGDRRRRGAPGDGDRPRRPALAGDRPRRPERPPRRPPHRLARRHQVRDRVRLRRTRRSSSRAKNSFDGRCMAVLSNGRRCPNAAIPGSTYCGLPPHQALRASRPARSRSSPTLSEAEVAILADPDADEGQVDRDRRAGRDRIRRAGRGGRGGCRGGREAEEPQESSRREASGRGGRDSRRPMAEAEEAEPRGEPRRSTAEDRSAEDDEAARAGRRGGGAGLVAKKRVHEIAKAQGVSSARSCWPR